MLWQKFVLWLLLPEQKEHRAAVANDLIQTATNEADFLKKVIPGAESWDYGCDLEMKAQLSQWELSGSPHWKKVQQDQDHGNCVFDWEGVVHHEYTPPGQTISKECCLNVLHWLGDAIQ